MPDHKEQAIPCSQTAEQGTCEKAGKMSISKKTAGKRYRKWILLWILCNTVFIAAFLFFQNSKNREKLESERSQMQMIQGENREIKDSEYDRKLAVTCDNGTFVGQKKTVCVLLKGFRMPSRRWAVFDGKGRLTPVPIRESMRHTITENPGSRRKLILKGHPCICREKTA